MGKETKVLINRVKVYYSVHVGKFFLTGGDRKRGDFFLSSNPERERAHKFYDEKDAKEFAKELKGTIIKHTIHELTTELIEEVTINE
ncbi:hypothetical protein FZC76_16010 [Sutcliffiella horikoshii]|uniref:Uncharacterized protein n=1 Tax=Sutcliffiella horikoshii TaxID=79883 RepID=A0A5D4SXU0_9BACI|nr:hypothetical protein [Sutcliffiella horikoshii]TYS67032.1 hypothetical protein FZC76_16010 [Sutcliffiella horikoshii]